MEYRTRGVCSTRIYFDIDQDRRVHNVRFDGGCDGNLKAVGILVEGMRAEEVIAKLGGNTCGGKSTSCADQLSKALKLAMEK